MNENNVAVSMPNDFENFAKPKQIKPMKPNYFEKYERKTTSGLILISVLYAFLYASCFFGREVLPQLSFTIFCYSTMFLLHFTLKALGLIQNKHAYIWYVPIAVISLFNSIFYMYTYTYLNIIMVHVLFAVFAINVTTNQPLAADVMGYAGRVISVIIGDWIAFSRLVGKTVRGQGASEKERETLVKILQGALISVPFLVIAV